jgi:hypothetical protein
VTDAPRSTAGAATGDLTFSDLFGFTAMIEQRLSRTLAADGQAGLKVVYLRMG